jgi:hypothetical protein
MSCCDTNTVTFAHLLYATAHGVSSQMMPDRLQPHAQVAGNRKELTLEPVQGGLKTGGSMSTTDSTLHPLLTNLFAKIAPPE